jgi:glycine cleavage system H lipoate-binding protein
LERRRPRRSPTAASPALSPQALVNSAAESDAWFVKLTLGPGADAETKTLLDAKAYKAHCDADAASH